MNSVEALSEALSEWGDEVGAIVVVSHDRAFCSKIEFTHVATVENGKFEIEQRSTIDSDWEIEDMSASSSLMKAAVEETKPVVKKEDMDPALRKKAYNAPKRIAKLESLIEETEGKIAAIDEQMLLNGKDVGKLLELTKKRKSLESKVSEYSQEWEQLEELLLQFA